jgi:hypothetical protein
MALGRILGSEADVEIEAGNDDSQTVGANNPHAFEFTGLGKNLPFEDEPIFTRFSESGGKDDESLYSRLAALPDKIRDGRGRRTDHGQVRNFGQAFYISVTGNAQNRFDAGIYRVHDPAKATSDQVCQNLASDAVGILGDTDKGDALGIEYCIKSAYSHNGLLNIL